MDIHSRQFSQLIRQVWYISEITCDENLTTSRKKIARKATANFVKKFRVLSCRWKPALESKSNHAVLTFTQKPGPSRKKHTLVFVKRLNRGLRAFTLRQFLFFFFLRVRFVFFSVVVRVLVVWHEFMVFRKVQDRSRWIHRLVFYLGYADGVF